MTHTPGTWDVDRPGWRNLRITVLGPDGITLQHGSRPLPERQANARLMAAAPDLLEAARAALLVLLQNAADDYTEATIRDLQAAIAKATEEVQYRDRGQS